MLITDQHCIAPGLVLLFMDVAQAGALGLGRVQQIHSYPDASVFHVFFFFLSFRFYRPIIM